MKINISGFRKWVLLAALLFTGGLIADLTTPPEFAMFFARDIESLQELASMLQPFSVLTMIFIFFRNASVLVFSFILSPVFLIMPVMALIVNGWLITFISAIIVREESIGFVLAGLLPHGIFEIPALIIGEGAALSFGAAIMLGLFSQEQRKSLKTRLKKSLSYLTLAIILMLPAAAIETFVTPLFIGQ